jgi:hypothetical protein
VSRSVPVGELVLQAAGWIPDLARSWLACRRGVRVQKGDQLRTLVDIPTIGLVYFRAPFSSGFRCTIPKGAVLEVYHTSGPRALGFACTLVDKELESQLVPASDLAHEKYAGHAFQFGLGEVGRRLEIIDSRAER